MMFKFAIKSITRNKKENLPLFLGLIVTSLMVMITFGTYQISEQIQNKITSNIGSTFEIQTPLQNSENDSLFSRDSLEENLLLQYQTMLNSSNIVKSNYSIVPNQNFFNSNVTFSGKCFMNDCTVPVIKGVMSEDFISLGSLNHIKVIEGEVLTQADIDTSEMVTLLPKDALHLDGTEVKIGDVININGLAYSLSDYDTEIVTGFNFVVKGFYEVVPMVNVPSSPNSFGNSFNTIYISGGSLRGIIDDMKMKYDSSLYISDTSLFYGEIFGHTSKPVDTTNVIEQLQEVKIRPTSNDGLESFFEYETQDKELEKLIAPLEMFVSISSFMLVVSILFGVFMLFLLIRDNIKRQHSEMALLISLGNSSFYVFRKTLTQLLILSGIGMVISTVVSFTLLNFISKALSKSLIIGSHNINYFYSFNLQFLSILYLSVLLIIVVNTAISMIYLFSKPKLFKALSEL